MKINILKIVLFALFIWNFNGCKQKPQEQVNMDDSNEYIDSTTLSKIVYLLPSPSELMQVLADQNVKLKPNLAAPTGIEKNIILSNQQSLILGVYLTDISYNILAKNYQTSISNLNSIQYLSQNLGLNQLIPEKSLRQIEKNINNVDSLDFIFDDFVQNSFNTISTTGNQELLSLVAMGVGIESMHFCFESINVETLNDTIIPFILSQKEIYHNFYLNFLNYNRNKTELKKFINDVSIIYSMYKKDIITDDKVSVISKGKSDFAIKKTVNPYFNNVNLKKLIDSIEIVRKNLVELKYQ